MAKKLIPKIDRDPLKSYFVHKHGIHVYPVSEFEFKVRRGITDYSAIKTKRWYIEVNNNGVRKVFPKTVSDSELNESIWKTIVYYYNLLNEETKVTNKLK